MLISRRSVVASGVGMLVGTTAGSAMVVERKLVRTISQTMGPFYPVARPLDQDADLTLVRGNRGKAKGQIINVGGRVLDPDGRPLANARLDLWQANAAGRYAHPGDHSTAPLDLDFQGSAVIMADAEGRYRFRTVKPGAYGGRTPHIHFAVTGRSQRLTTQMYFPGEARNATDGLLGRIPAGPHRDRMIARAVAPPRDDDDVPAFEWDIVLATS